MKPYTVIGRYPNGIPCVVHVESTSAMEARRCAVQKVAFEVYDGSIPDGLAPMNEAIAAVSKDFELVAVLDGHHVPAQAACRYIFHGAKSALK